MPIILISHGDFAKSAKNSIELITGKNDQWWAFGVYDNTSVDELGKEISDLIQNIGEAEDILILCDVLGGSPSNIAFNLVNHYKNVHALVGFNFPVLMELSFIRNQPINNVVKKLKKTFIESFVQLKIIDSNKSSSGNIDL